MVGKQPACFPYLDLKKRGEILQGSRRRSDLRSPCKMRGKAPCIAKVETYGILRTIILVREYTMNKILTTNLIKVIKSCNTEEELKELLIGLFTPQELEVVDTRLEIVKQLKRGKSQRAIAEELGVGIATVTRGAREVKQGRFEVIK